MGGLTYSKNYVARSRMEEVLLQDEQEQARRSQPALLAGVGEAPLRKRDRREVTAAEQSR